MALICTVTMQSAPQSETLKHAHQIVIPHCYHIVIAAFAIMQQRFIQDASAFDAVIDATRKEQLQICTVNDCVLKQMLLLTW